ncbi:hypothetical protein AsFPU1_3159 [Aphanothece sacrum FPU1]|uniref:Ig-like domain-containing protein n=2 Tax=Aphanothece sacrum TaxID=1122 RepID=A0A401IKF0_APHSA|nr:hypothetical protein AsFPU1_3159 [Aphanothece sacrum FPU1]GBF85097.1 hypothetical protein AsFPU3_2154 [Aphanothece sacrum FPU3]
MATLVIVSLPEFVYQATSTKNDIITVAAAIFCFLTVHRLLEKLNINDLILLILCLLFGFSSKTTFMAFIIPFTLLFGLLLLRKYRLGIWIKLISQNRWSLILLIVPAFILSQIWLFIHNYNFWGGWSGPNSEVLKYQQSSGLKGGIANLVRYIFQTCDFLNPSDIIFNRIFGFTISGTLQKIYEYFLAPVLGDAGLHKDYSFNILWQLHEDGSWFGPFGFLLIIPGIIYSILTGPKSLKALSLTLLGYVFIVVYQIVWMPWNNRFFSLFFASSGVCIAYLIKSVKIRQNLLIKIIKYTSIFILFFSCAINSNKPLLLSPNKILTGSDLIPFKWPYTVVNDSIWAKTNLGSNRLYYAERHYGDQRVSLFTKLIPVDSKIALVTGENTWIYHYLLLNPDVKFTSVSLSSLKSSALEFDYILCLQLKCNLNNIPPNSSVLWYSTSSTQQGKLIQLKR